MLRFTSEVEKLLHKINEYSIIVEGKKDRTALNSLGLNNIIDISSKDLETFVDSLSINNEYIILTDFDNEGEDKKQKIYKFFDRTKIRFNHNLRLKFQNVFKVVKIEEINKKLVLMEDDFNGKISPINDKIFDRSRFLCKRSSRKT